MRSSSVISAYFDPLPECAPEVVPTVEPRLIKLLNAVLEVRFVTDGEDMRA